ncbi:MAG: HD domain-containing protein [Gallionellaceae bacterium]|nr:HD domain-containing protein [Gallionellaceae bacterium]
MDAPVTNLSVSGLDIDLREAICCLTEALNLVGVDERQHGERVACMATETARRLGWQGEALSDLLHAGLLHDCGVSSTRVHARLVSELDWDGSERHCKIGAAYLGSFRPLAHLAPVIRWHHSHWSVLSANTDVDEKIALMSNLIYLVDRADALLAQYRRGGDPAPFDRIRDKLASLSGAFFAPSLVDAFLECSRGEAFWLALEPLDVAEYVFHFDNPGAPRIESRRDLHDLASLFAHIVDAKSPYTYEHSRGVARLASRLAQLDGLSDERVCQVEIAGLLHDLGKLGVPDEILESSAPLDHDSRAIMHRHSYDTFRILHRIRGMEEIAGWAGCHHETLIGDGYPFQYEASRLPREARIIAVADVFQALAQDRPYRKGMSPQDVLSLLVKMRDDGKLDGEVVALVAGDLQACYEAAMPKEGNGLPWGGAE